eukprot:scaffold20775_cov109-Isochrysis_galbana.AAC.8
MAPPTYAEGGAQVNGCETFSLPNTIGLGEHTAPEPGGPLTKKPLKMAPPLQPLPLCRAAFGVAVIPVTTRRFYSALHYATLPMPAALTFWTTAPARIGRAMISLQESPIKTWKFVNREAEKVPKYSWPYVRSRVVVALQIMLFELMYVPLSPNPPKNCGAEPRQHLAAELLPNAHLHPMLGCEQERLPTRPADPPRGKCSRLFTPVFAPARPG